MIYNNYKDIPFDFLHDAAMVISKRHKLKSIYMDKQGGVALTFQGKLSEEQVKDILLSLSPNPNKCSDDYTLEYSLHYSYSNNMQETYVYSEDDIDYRI